MEWLAVPVMALAALAAIYMSPVFRRKVRAFEWAHRQNYVRLWPNPGFRIGKHKWSVFYKGRLR